MNTTNSGKLRRSLSFVFFIALCLFTGYISGDTTASAIDGWYRTLNKPFFNPPDWVFAPVWTTLFIFMGIAGARIYNKGTDKSGVKKGLMLFVLQLALNAAWSQFFFGMQYPALALADILILLTVILLCIRQYFRIDKTAAWLFVPYALWVTFATLLNASIVFLN